MVSPRGSSSASPELPARDLDRRREAGIEIENIDLDRRFSRHGERLRRAALHRGRPRDVVALAQIPVIVAVGAAVQEHPFALGDAERRASPTDVMTTAAAWSMKALAFIRRG